MPSGMGGVSVFSGGVWTDAAVPSLRLITAPWRSTARRSGWSGCGPFWRRP